MKYLDEILLEWSIGAKDGLRGGAMTEENIAALAKVLENRGHSKDEILEIISPMLDEAQPRIPKEKVVEDPFPDKVFQPTEIAFSLKKILEKNTPSTQEFLRNKNRARTVEEAIDLYNNMDKSLLLEINKIKTGQARAALGVGEIPLVWFLNGAKHGGGDTGDILTKDGLKIDVKAGEASINIERNSFDSFNSIPFISDLAELIESFRNPSVNDFAKSILHEPAAKEDLTQHRRNGETVITQTEKFLDTYDMGKFGALTIAGINYIGSKVKELADSGMPGTTMVSVFSKGEKHSAAVNNTDPNDVVNTIKSVEGEKNNRTNSVELNVKPLEKDDPTIALSKLLKLRFFKKGWTVESMWESLSPHLHYDGIILVTKTGDQALPYIPKENFKTKFAFRGLQKGITISYIEKSNV